jgi:hypothetical protein
MLGLAVVIAKVVSSAKHDEQSKLRAPSSQQEARSKLRTLELTKIHLTVSYSTDILT